YNRIFHFLLHLRRTQMRLHRVWTATATAARRARAPGGASGDTAFDPASSGLPPDAWRLRTSMTFFLDCLWSYVQMDVIAVAYHQLLSKLHASPQAKPRTPAAAALPAPQAAPRPPSPPATPPAVSPPRPSRAADSDDPAPSQGATLPSSPALAPPPAAPTAATSTPAAAAAAAASTPAASGAAADLDALQAAHAEFLAAVVAGCFLEPAAVSGGGSGGAASGGLARFVAPTLGGAIAACDRFCAAADRAARSAPDPAFAPELERLAKEFDQHAGFLFRIFSGAREAGGGGGGG
ncbi:hypothetical protein HK405_015105, partial [Cladochytrium tenue]